jgi:hypothetical protein
MLKALAVIRTIVLVVLVVFTVRAMPIFLAPARTFDETFARTSQSVDQLQRAAWLAIAWVAIETALGWILATRKKTPAPATPAANR